MDGNAIVVNFAGGETSPKSRGRFDLPWYAASAKKILNFIPEVQGPARFRPGFKHVRQTRGGQVARMVPYQLNNSQAYMIEFTHLFMRVYKNGDLVTSNPSAVTGITKASPAVLTVAAAANLNNGDEIILTGVVGMPEINNRQVKLAAKAGSTFQLVDPTTGASIDSTTFGAWTSGGAVNKIYEIASPYTLTELPNLQWTQNNSTMYIVCGTQPPYKLKGDLSGNFTLATFARTADPFGSSGPVVNIEQIYRSGESYLPHLDTLVPAGETWVTFTSAYTEGVIYDIAAVVGTVEINGGQYKFHIGNTDVGGSAIRLTTVTGAYVNSAAWTAYVSGGTATPHVENPLAVAFYEGRLGYFGTNQRPDSMFLSRGPDGSGNPRYDDFTGGTAADFACFFALAPVSGNVDYSAWARGTSSYLFIGTFGGPFRVSGGGTDTPITPTSINARQFDNFGCESVMAAGGAHLFFIQRGGVTLRSAKVLNPYLATFESIDMCLNAEHIAYSRLQRVVVQQGRPDIVWVTRADGVLCGVTVHSSEGGADAVAGWHRHKIGGASAKILDVQTLPRTDKNDQLWIQSERLVNGVTRRCLEVQAEDVSFPDLEDFFVDGDTAGADLAVFRNALYRLQEQYIHTDGAATYNGAARGVTAAATMTPSLATVGTGRTFTASAAVFTAADVGSEIWKKPTALGVGAGRATITGYTNSTTVTCTITVAFDSTVAIPAGDWYFAVTTIYGAWHQEGSRVAVVTDGAVYSDGASSAYPTVTVANGKFTLPAAAAVVHTGFPYEGFIETHNLEIGGRDGPAQAKPRNIAEMYIRMMNTLGVEYGTDLYALEQVEQRDAGAAMDRPAPVFSGIRKLPYSDKWSAQTEKNVVISQRLPLPAIIQFISIEFSTTDD